MDLPLTITPVEKFTVVEFKTPSLMDPVQLQDISDALYKLVDEQDKRLLILDFEQVQYLSSQAVGILLTLNKKLKDLPNSRLIVCGVGARLAELLRITRLDKLLTVKETQKDAIRTSTVL